MLFARFVIAVFVALFILAAPPAYSNPIRAWYPGKAELDNVADYPDYVIVWISEPSPGRTADDRHSHGFNFTDGSPIDRVTPCAISRALFDSSNHRARAQLLSGTGPHKVCAETISSSWSDPLSDAHNAGYPFIEDVYHIVVLDAAEFRIKPVKTIYHLQDGSVREVMCARDSSQSSVHPAHLPVKSAAGSEQTFYVSLSCASLLAFGVTITVRRKRRQIV